MIESYSDLMLVVLFTRVRLEVSMLSIMLYFLCILLTYEGLDCGYWTKIWRFKGYKWWQYYKKIIKFSYKLKNVGASLVKQVASTTNDVVGYGKFVFWDFI